MDAKTPYGSWEPDRLGGTGADPAPMPGQIPISMLFSWPDPQPFKAHWLCPFYEEVLPPHPCLHPHTRLLLSPSSALITLIMYVRLSAQGRFS